MSPWAIPMSIMVSVGRGRRLGISPLMPARGASVPRAYPERSIDSAKIVYARSSVGCTITSYVCAISMRNSSNVTGCTCCPLNCTSVISSPGIRTSK